MAEEAASAEFLTKKAGPLPVGVWIALVAGGLGVTWYLNRNKGTKSPAETGSGETVTATGDGSYTPVGGAAGNASAGGSGNASGNTFADNNAWGTAAINYLISLGFDPGNVNQAIGQYLASQPLTTQQQAMVNSALQHFGSPPLIPAPVNGDVPGTGNQGTGSAMVAPTNLHLNKYPGNAAQLVWNADKNADWYDILITSDSGGKVQNSIPGPHANITTQYSILLQTGHKYTAVVTPRNASGPGPSASLNYSS